jgi:hypothetical protein
LQIGSCHSIEDMNWRNERMSERIGMGECKGVNP